MVTNYGFKTTSFQAIQSVLSSVQNSNNTPKTRLKSSVLYLLNNRRSEEHVDYVDYLINNNVVTNLDREIFPNDEPLSNYLDKYYNEGYRVFISDSGSGPTKRTFPWLKAHPYAFLINTSSTVNTDEFIDAQPNNFVRVSMDDTLLLDQLINDIFPNLSELLKIGNSSLITYLSNNEDEEDTENDNTENDNTENNDQPDATSFFPFKEIVYIYTSSLYTDGYLESLTNATKSKDVTMTVFEVPDPYDDNYDWTNIHNKLLENPLDDDYDVDNKILFIFNSSNGNEILHILERNENGDFYNNFVMITDALSPDTLETSHPFVFCMVTYGIFSPYGNKIQKKVDLTESLSPIVLASNDVQKMISGIFRNVYQEGANNPPNTFSSALTNVDIIENNNWNEDYLSVWMLESSLNDNNKYSQVLKLQLMRHKTNPIAISAVLDPTLVLSLENLESTVQGNPYYELRSWDQNREWMNNPKTDQDGIIYDSAATVFVTDPYKSRYIAALERHYTKTMSNILFMQWYVYHNLNKYKPPEIESQILDTFELDLFIDITNGYEDAITSSLSSDSSDNLTIPAQTIDDLKIIYIDEDTKEIYNNLTSNIPSTEIDYIDLRTFNLAAATNEFNIDIYNKGDMYRVGKLNENGDFELKYEFRDVVIQPVKITHKYIDHHYQVGDTNIIDISSSLMVTIVSIDETGYYIVVRYDDTGETATVTVDQLEDLNLSDEIERWLDTGIVGDGADDNVDDDAGDGADDNVDDDTDDGATY